MDKLIKNPLLSITIPTYNRLDYLVENLTHLLPQVQKYREEVEVIISDNCSDYNPQKEIEELSVKNNCNIKFYRQTRNIGSDSNVKFVSHKGEGDYVLILGDDDIFSPNFLDIVIPILRTHKYGAIHYGRLSGDENCSNNRIHNPIYNDSILELSPRDFVSYTLSMANFSSSFIVDKNCLLLGEYSIKENYYGYYWFANNIFGIIALEKPCLYYYFPLILMRNPNREWNKYWPLYSVVSLSNIFKDLDSKVPGVYQKWKERLHDNRFYNLPDILSSVSANKAFYRQKSGEFYPHLTKKERRFFTYWLWTPIPEISKKIYNNIITRITSRF